MQSHQFYSKEVRDPLYGYIYLTPLEVKLIDTEPFQRLDRLLQNPSARFVYPNATHTRKAHSLGVMHLAGILIKKLLMRQYKDIREQFPNLLAEPIVIKYTERDEYIEEKILKPLIKIDLDWWDSNIKQDPAFIIEAIRIAALMHDLGHGPFSHIFEEAVRKSNVNKEFRHEIVSIRILSFIDEYIKPNDKLNEKEKEIVDTAINILKDEPSSFIHSLLDSPLDIDKLDYLNRDAYHAGPLELGMIDFERVLDGLRIGIEKDKDKLLFTQSTKGALARTFKAIQDMYSNVYYHKTSRAVDLQLFEILTKNAEMLESMIQDEKKYIAYWDDILLLQIKNNGKEDSRKLAEDLLSRRMKYKAKSEKNIPLGLTFKYAKKELEEIKNEIENKFSSVDAKVDYFSVSPVRLDVANFLNWIDSRIFLTSNGRSVKLEELDPVLYRELLNFGVLIRLYVDREKYSSEASEEAKNEFNREIDEIIKIASK
ncbi:MAG: HD domain-containing protein [Nitrososphaeria archaeon]